MSSCVFCGFKQSLAEFCLHKLNGILIIVFLILGCNSSNNSSEKKENQKGIERKFAFREFNFGVEIFLREDFSFLNFSYSYGCLGGYRIKEVWGKYKIDDNIIEFFPQKLVWKEDWEEHYFGSKRTFDTLEFYYSDSTKIQSNYWYLKSENIEFLVSEAAYDEQDEYFIKSSNFIAFANLYNLNADEKIDSWVFCNSDTTINLKSIFSKKNIPEKFKAMFFDEPKEFTIKSVKVNKELYPVYEIRKNENKDIYTGMELYSEKYPESPITVIEIKNDKLIGVGENLFYENTKLKSGTKLSTKKNSNQHS